MAEHEGGEQPEQPTKDELIVACEIAAGTDLEQSSLWTGNERTLTTTQIVRPWAYVGLSEDFFGRIGSHRQSKPEWRRALLVRSGAQPLSSDDIKYVEQKVHAVLLETAGETHASGAPRQPVGSAAQSGLVGCLRRRRRFGASVDRHPDLSAFGPWAADPWDVIRSPRAWR